MLCVPLQLKRNSLPHVAKYLPIPSPQVAQHLYPSDNRGTPHYIYLLEKLRKSTFANLYPSPHLTS